MLSVPLKKSLGVQFSKPLSTYIQNVYQKDPANYQMELRQLDDLRQDCIVAMPSISSIFKLARYVGQLQQLPQWFPMGDDGIKINFPWFNLTGKDKKPVVSFNVKFEEAAIVFNIGAMYSQLASQENAGSVEGLKRGCNFYLLAAGAFEVVKDRYVNNLQIPGGPDLVDNVLCALIQLMLAHAQECVVLKALLEKTVKDTTLAKLAWSTAAFFEASREYAGKSPLLASFMDLLPAKCALYRAIAHYRKSSEFLITLQYGKEIVKLQEADEAIKELKDLMKKLPTDILSQVSVVSVSISKNLERAVKDNQLIYHDPIPARGSWGDCGAVVIVKSIKFPDESLVKEVESPFVLEKLPSLLINQQVNELCQQRNSMFNEILNRLNVAVESVDKLFSRLELPAAVEALSTPEGVPESLVVKAQEVTSLGGYSAIKNSIETLQKLRNDCLEMLKEIKVALENEETKDNEMRDLFGGRWSRPLSSQLNGLLMKKLNELVDVLNKNEASDAKVVEIYDQHIPGIISLCSSRDELEEIIPASTARNVGFNTSILAEITSALSRREEFRTQRESFLQLSRATLEGVDIVSRIYELENRSSEAINIVSVELSASLTDIKANIENFEREIEGYSRMLERLMAEFLSERKSSTSQERQVALQNLGDAYNAYKAISAQLQGGLQFYSDIFSQVEQLKPSCINFVNSRLLEKEQMKERLELQQTISPHPSIRAPYGDISTTTASIYGQQHFQYQQPVVYAPIQPHPGAWNPSIPIQYYNHPLTSYYPQPAQTYATRVPPPSSSETITYGYPPNVSSPTTRPHNNAQQTQYPGYQQQQQQRPSQHQTYPPNYYYRP